MLKFSQKKSCAALNSLYIFIFCFYFICLHSLTFAQNSLFIDQYPKELKEDQEVYFTLKGEDYNLDSAKITWKIDGKAADEGVGRTTLKSTAPKQNKIKVITAIISSGSGEDIFIQLTVKASPYFMMYEGADTYTPPFYKGRAMPTKEGKARLGIVSLGEKNEVKWSINNSKIKQNNNIITFDTGITDNRLDIDADIYEGESLKSSQKKTINLKNSELILFTTDKDNNTKAETIGNEKGSDVYIRVEPYFFSAKNKRDSDLRLVWSIDGTKQNVKDPYFVKFNSNKKEEVSVKLEARQVNKVTQRAEKVFNINFE
jgi:hypothetical protein